MSPSIRTMRFLKAEGWECANVERYDMRTRRRHDLFGMFDILAVSPIGTRAVQVTSASNVSARVKKLQANPILEICKEAGWIVEVHGWRKDKDIPRIVTL